jgi:hypothetical protein
MLSDMASRDNGGSGKWPGSPWVVATIILAVLIAVGGLAYYEFTSTTSTNAVGRYGAVGIPGKAVLRLPAGTADISFSEVLSNQVIDVPAFGISVVSASTGQQVDVKFRNGSASSVNGVSYAPIGSVQIPRAGKYDVDVTGTDPSAPNPQLQFGTSTTHAVVLHAALGVAGLVVLLSVVLPWLRRRKSRRRSAWRARRCLGSRHR